MGSDRTPRPGPGICVLTAPGRLGYNGDLKVKLKVIFITRTTGEYRRRTTRQGKPILTK